MALGALSLSVTSGVQGRAFSAAINGLTTGKVEILNDGSPGFSTVNGRLSSQGLPYPVSTAVLREYDPGVGAGYRDTRIDIIAATSASLQAQAIASLGVGRSLVRYRIAATRQGDGSIVYTLRVEDDLGATTSNAIGSTPIPIARQIGVRADATATLASQEAWLGAPFDHIIVFAEQSNAANSWAVNLAFTQSEIAKWQGSGRALKWAVPVCTGVDPIAQTIDGTNDGVIRQTLEAINDAAVAGGYRPWMRLGWEMNLLTAYPWGVSKVSDADYIAAVQHIQPIAKSINRDFVVQFVPSFRKDSGVDFANRYPGDAYIDVIGIDAYMLVVDQGAMTPAQHADFMFTAPFGINKVHDFAVAHNKPFTFDEVGLDYDNPPYLTTLFDKVREWNVPHIAYWDQNGGGFQCKLSTDQWPNSAYAYVRNCGPFHITSWALAAAPNGVLSAPITASKPIAKVEIVSGTATASGINVQATAQASGTRRITVRATDERGLTATRSVALTWQNGTIWSPDTYFGARLVDWYDASDASTLQRHLGAVKFINSKVSGGRQAAAPSAPLRPTYTVVNGRPMLTLAGAQALVQTDVTGTPVAQAAVVYSAMVTTGAGAANFSYFVADSDATGGGTNTRSLGYNANNLRLQGSSALAGGPLVGAERSVVASFGAGATSAVRSSVDGAAALTGSVTIAATTYTKRVLGATGSASNNIGNYYTGALAEHYVVSGTVTAAEEDLMAGYNMWKGIAESSAAFQASASAYKTNPPMLP